jgi:hypothetical protein
MNARIRQLTAAMAAPAILLASVSCGNVARTGRSPSFVVIDKIEAASGAKDSDYHAFLLSDVQTLVKRTVAGVEQLSPTIFNDPGKVTMRTLLKDAGNPGAQTAPSNINAVTITRYRVVFHRADGRNTQGVDVPYAFDGATTATLTSAPSEVGFELVRHQAKEEAPLRALIAGGGSIFLSAIADVTFYGRDQAGNEITVTGSISVEFADFADPS